MRTAIFEEYKSAYSDIQSTNFDEEAITLIIKAVDDVLTAAQITNNDSILALDDYATKLLPQPVTHFYLNHCNNILIIFFPQVPHSFLWYTRHLEQ